MFKHLLVPTDGSQLSADAVQRAVSFAREANAKITFLHVKAGYPVTYFDFGEGSMVNPNTAELFAKITEEQSQKILADCANLARDAGVMAETVSFTSDIPHDAIIDVAEKNNCDLVFMASHGRRGLGGLLLGSETHKVLTHSKIPVLVYR